MPTYSYACTECDNRFDAVQAFTEDSLTTCPQCSGRLRKLFNSVGVVFKGSGFYRTDSRESGKNSSTGSTSSDTSGSSEKSGSEKSGAKESGSSTSNNGSQSTSSSSSSGSSTTTAAASS